MVAGMSDMHYRDFFRFNILGGVVWGAGLPLIGYYFGHIEWVQHYFELIIIGIVLFSFIPAAWHLLGSKEKRAKFKNNLHEGRAAYKEHRVQKKAKRKQ